MEDTTGSAADVDTIEAMLAMVRSHMEMDVAFVSRFDGAHRILREVSATPGVAAPQPGDIDPLEDTYCKPLVEGRIAPVVRDATREPAIASLPITTDGGIRSYIGSPILLADGSVYGTLCAFSPSPKPSLTDRDARFIRLMAGLVGERVQREIRQQGDLDRARQRVRSALTAGDPTVALQPIVDLRAERTVGYEALARFASAPQRGPDAWFADATAAGLAVELEVAAARQALATLPSLGDAYVAINVSPPVLCSDELLDLLVEGHEGRVVLEITEHDVVQDFRRMRATMLRLRRRNIFIALDDVGAGYAGLTQILRLDPDMVKLDRLLIRGVATDAARRSLVTAAVSFARSTGTVLVAEGVEDGRDVTALCELGVPFAQGFFLGRPQPLSG